MKRLAVDIETDGLDAKEIYCVVARDLDEKSNLHVYTTNY